MKDPYGSWNEGSWGMTPFIGEGVNNNAPMRVGVAPENYNTTGGYALYVEEIYLFLMSFHFYFSYSWIIQTFITSLSDYTDSNDHDYVRPH